jgi:2'-5' RNA ligase
MTAEPRWQRHFLALVPDDRAREALAAAAVPPGARVVRAADLHLTLLFLGTLAPEAEGAVLQAVGGSHAAVRIRLDVVELWKGPRAWVGVPAMEDPRVARLAAEVEAAVLPLLGEERLTEARGLPFRTHVTLARAVPGTPASLHLVKPVEWEARELRLMASGGPAAPTRYATRGVVPLKLNASSAIP